MGMKGKLITSIEVKCGEHLIHEMFHTNTHHIPNINPTKYKHFEIHEGETVKIGSVVSWKYNQGNTYFSALSHTHTKNMLLLHQFFFIVRFMLYYESHYRKLFPRELF